MTRQRSSGAQGRLVLTTALMFVLGACAATTAPTGVTSPGQSGAPSVAPTATPGETAIASAEPSSPSIVDEGEAWIVFQGAPLGLSLIRPDGTGNHVILGPPGDQVHADWSPDGSRIAYVQATQSSSAIWITDPRGSTPEPLLAEVPAAFSGLFWDNPAWSPDGSRIATVAYEGNPGAELPTRSILAIVTVESGEIAIVGELEQADGLLHSFPRWSPDGAAFVINVDHFDGQEFLGSEVAIVRESEDAWSAPDPITDVAQWARPDWHPTEGLIVFCSYDIGSFQSTDEPSNLFTIRSDGTELTQITDFGAGEDRASQPSWTSDGRIIFAHVTGTDDERRSVAFINADGPEMEIAVPSGFIGEHNRPHPRLRPVP